MKHQKKKELLLLATKLIEKILDARNAKEYYQSFLKNRTKKFVKRSKIITQQRNIPENPNIIDIKSVDIEHSKTSHKLSKTKRQAKKVFQEGAGKNFYSPLCSETTKRENILSKNNAKKNKKRNDLIFIQVTQILLLIILLILKYSLKILNMRLEINKQIC